MSAFIDWGSNKGRIVHLSENVVEVLGYPRPDLIGQNLASVLPLRLKSSYEKIVDENIEALQISSLLGESEPVILLDGA